MTTVELQKKMSNIRKQLEAEYDFQADLMELMEVGRQDYGHDMLRSEERIGMLEDMLSELHEQYEDMMSDLKEEYKEELHECY